MRLQTEIGGRVCGAAGSVGGGGSQTQDRLLLKNYEKQKTF